MIHTHSSIFHLLLKSLFNTENNNNNNYTTVNKIIQSTQWKWNDFFKYLATDVKHLSEVYKPQDYNNGNDLMLIQSLKIKHQIDLLSWILSFISDLKDLDDKHLDGYQLEFPNKEFSNLLQNVYINNQSLYQSNMLINELVNNCMSNCGTITDDKNYLSLVDSFDFQKKLSNFSDLCLQKDIISSPTLVNDLDSKSSSDTLLNIQKQMDIDLQDWNNQFNSMIPSIESINLTKPNTSSKKKQYLPNILNDLVDIDDDSQEMEDIQYSQNIEIDSVNTTSVQQNRMTDEEVESLHTIRDIMQKDPINTIKLHNEMPVLLNLPDIDMVISILEIEDSKIMKFIGELVLIDMSFINVSKYLQTLLLPIIMSLKSTLARDSLEVVTLALQKQHSAIINSVFIPMIYDPSKFTSFQFDVILKALSDTQTSQDIKLIFFDSLLIFLRKQINEKSYQWNEYIITLVANNINFRLPFTENIFSNLLEVLNHNTPMFSKDAKMTQLIYKFLLGYQTQLKPYYSKLQDILIKLDPSKAKLSFSLLEKIKNQN
ncbi:hypothetical protein DLAC_01737 [Tieghemostelium lacteum]|uniref:Uncharacterized protein n=1 Tax=Tieghemostelium lacteum TaxID=361077 RepID=A0A152A666_TIELA|nr:hypothetical protein DLAC_01737 [Tieghemostelium lacteum]|eukprot:KYR01726.1 hypothetical protein DLAC_01737 [Tieghemostelium lacteum]